MSNYASNHQQITKKLYEELQEKAQVIKNKTITKANKTRDNRLDYAKQNVIYVQSHNKRNKISPR